MAPTVAVIGLGNIGGGVARNLARAGYEVHAVDLDPAKVAGVTAVGGLDGHSAANAASCADVVFTRHYRGLPTSSTLALRSCRP